MHQIAYALGQTRYTRAPHGVILIDGTPLDAWLADRSPEHDLLGLVPTLLDWMCDPAEGTFAWQQLDSPLHTRTIAPVLMCPDDCDFSCTLVVVEVETTATTVIWHRFGHGTASIDLAWQPPINPAAIQWFASAPPLVFARSDYQACLAGFRTAPATTSDLAPEEDTHAPTVD